MLSVCRTGLRYVVSLACDFILDKGYFQSTGRTATQTQQRLCLSDRLVTVWSKKLMQLPDGNISVAHLSVLYSRLICQHA